MLPVRCNTTCLSAHRGDANRGSKGRDPALLAFTNMLATQEAAGSSPLPHQFARLLLTRDVPRPLALGGSKMFRRHLSSRSLIALASATLLLGLLPVLPVAADAPAGVRARDVSVAM